MRIARTVLGLLCALPALAQTEDHGWTFRARFQGSSNEIGLILKANPSAAFSLSRELQVYAGFPVYFVRNSLTRLQGGIGNAYVGAGLDLDTSVVRYMSDLVLTAPTGSTEKGFSTGRASVDWTNTFSRTFSSWTPFGSLGIGNTVSDTAFFVRPFSTDGMVSHFEGGGIYGFTSIFSVGASGYAVRASGEQEIIERQPAGRGQGRTAVATTRTIRETANDHGISTWLSVTPGSKVDYQVGYSRSAAYDLNSLFFGIGVRVSR